MHKGISMKKAVAKFYQYEVAEWRVNDSLRVPRIEYRRVEDPDGPADGWRQATLGEWSQGLRPLGKTREKSFRGRTDEKPKDYFQSAF